MTLTSTAPTARTSTTIRSRRLRVLALVATAPAQAVTVTASGPGINGANLAAQATFDISGDVLTISLTNTADDDEQNDTDNQDVPGNTLTGLFFDFLDNPTLTKDTATITAGSLLQDGTCTGLCDGTTTNVGGEFGFATSWTGGPSAGYGISSSGYIGGSGTLFDATANLDDPASPDGINFGIISRLGVYDPNGGLAGDPVIQDTVTFTFTGATGLSVDNISNVSFQYGTDFDEPNVVPVPAAVRLRPVWSGWHSPPQA